jgi:hypothetical protein
MPCQESGRVSRWSGREDSSAGEAETAQLSKAKERAQHETQRQERGALQGPAPAQSARFVSVESRRAGGYHRCVRLSLLLAVLLLCLGTVLGDDEPTPRSHIQVRGVYGGVPQSLMESGKPLTDSGINAVWIGERGITDEPPTTSRSTQLRRPPAWTASALRRHTAGRGSARPTSRTGPGA